MKLDFLPYECQFTIEERRKLTAQSIQQIRKNKGYTQKQVAELLGISQPSYSSYENGQTNIPTEMLVRLSFLFETEMNTLVQKERFFTTQESAKALLAQYREQLQEARKSNPELSEAAEEMYTGLMQMLDSLMKISDDPELTKQLNEPICPDQEK